jgi:hypothetical protein
MSKSWCTYLIATRPTYKCPSKHGTSLQILSVNTQLGQVVHMRFQPTILQKMHDHHPNLGCSHHSNQIKSIF